ncbi:armadillo-type protein [Geopyxis carbonaria]|nr:armadillo-type protein [Geopyxis carbonaria]
MTTKDKPARGKKGGTGSSRNFSYKSFSHKISNLKIDPVRRVRRHIDDEETQSSFFHAAFLKWAELNLSTTFTAAVRELRPLCESLPLILHHKDHIFAILETYIAQRDALALEPLLDLLAQFAHDLGAAFEPYLARAVGLLSALAASHTDFATIEWTFNALAYLLKYLSRLLAPDLRALFDVLAPLLGREPQKRHVSRFAAEALSFLVRKAKGESLTLIVRYVLADLRQHAAEPKAAGYPDGLMTMFYEACIGVDRTIHSRGPAVFEALLWAVLETPDETGVCAQVAQGVLTALIHHTSQDTFSTMLTPFLEFTQTELLQSTPDAQRLALAGRLLYTAIGVRKGSRIGDWEAVGSVAAKILDAAAKLDGADEAARDAVWQCLRACTMVIQYADLDVVISKCSRTAERARDWHGGALFVPFCEFVSGLGQERFGQFVLPYVQRFILSQWTSHEAELFLLIPKLHELGLLTGEATDFITRDSQLTKRALATFARLQTSLENGQADNDCMITASHTLNVLSSLCSPKDASAQAELFQPQLVSLLQAASSQPKNAQIAPVVGRTLSFLSRAAAPALPVDTLATLFQHYTTNTAFLSGAYTYLKQVGITILTTTQQTSLCDTLIPNLSSPSHDARRTTLFLLDLFSSTWPSEAADTPDILRTLGLIEDTPFAITNQRNLAMYVRKLGMEYGHLSPGSRYRTIVPWYCFGLMTVRFAPMWEDAAKALAMVTEANEELVAELAFKWLSGEGLDADGSAPPAPEDVPHMDLTPFQCSNLETLERVSQACTLDDFALKAALGQQYETDAASHAISRATARSQALQVLCEIPQVAERRSRLLVPMFLEWSTHSAADPGDDDDNDDSPTDAAAAAAADTAPSKWSRRDQTAMLTLFSKFTNARSLFRAADVHASLLRLLTTGDPKVQALALKCIVTWKTPAIRVYGDRLTNLLDDTMFRDELTHFVQVSEDESQIATEHRAELMPVLLRLLYGRALSRKHASSGKKGMSSTRTAILASLVNLRPEEQKMFLEIALGDLKDVGFVDRTNPAKVEFNTKAIGSVHFSLRKQVGLVRMVEDLLKQLGANLLPYLHLLLDAVLYCLLSSIASTSNKTEKPENEEQAIAAKAAKGVRISGFKCLTGMFHFCPTFDWAPYMPAIFAALVDPRLPRFAAETAQGVGSLLTLFSTWANSRHTILFLADYNDKLVATIGECLVVESVKDDVVQFIVQLLLGIVGMATPPPSDADADSDAAATAAEVTARIIRPNVDTLLDRLSSILSKSLRKEVLESCIACVAALAPFVSAGTETTRLVRISVFLLDQPTRRVSPKTKSDVLRILVAALPGAKLVAGDDLHAAVFRTVSSLFGFFRDRDSRLLLAGVLNEFAAHDPALTEVAALSTELNAFSAKRLDEPDFARRLAAYEAINEHRWTAFTPRQWRPLLHNMFFFIRDPDELAIRTGASYALKRFIEAAAVPGAEAEMREMLVDTVLPIVRNGAGEASELVRLEWVSLMAHIVLHHASTLPEVSDLTPLLAAGDAEASFFTNILHIQAHRRQRALRRLSTISGLDAGNIAKFLLPLLEHFVFDAAEDAHNLAHEAVLTIGVLTQQLQWAQWRAVARRYVGFVESKREMARVVIRLVGGVVDAVVRAAGENETEEEEGDATKAVANGDDKEKDSDEVMADADKEPTEDEDMADAAAPAPKSRLAATLPEPTKLGTDIATTFLPPLTAYLHKKDDSTVALRVPVAISLVKLLKLLPSDMMRTRLPAVLMDICHILRSRAQDDRDMTRKTLSEIALLLGAPYVSFILKELKGSLQRGYQLHVRSYTVHSMLVALVPVFAPGALDYCVPALVEIVLDDIFGATGAEKDAEGYVGKMKEVKASKSYDSMEILARITTLPHLGRLVRPIKNLLQERLDGKMIKKIDELLRRVTVGLGRNETLKDRDLLVFCYEIVQEVYKTQTAPAKETVVDEKRARYLVNLKAPSKEQSKVATSSNVFKLTRFALDIVRTLLGQHDELATPENLAGFVPILGDAILASQEEVQISALRLLTAITRVELPAIDDGARIFVDKAVSFIKSSPSTNADIAQASLKLLSALLRERRSVAIKDTTLAYVLRRIQPDLEEPDRQGVTFKFVKAILARRVQIPEVYEIMDHVAAVMVTNQTRSVCDACRSLYFTFLMDYPQGAARWKKQLAFLVRNLEYKHEAGRKSVLEAIHSVLAKMGDAVIQEIVATFFVPLTMVMVNDDAAECRQMAGMLLKTCWTRADAERTTSFLALLKAWSAAGSQPLLVRVALQVYGLYFDVAGAAGQPSLPALLPRITAILAASVAPLTADQNTPITDDDAEGDWETLYYALQLYTKLVPLFPAQTLAAGNADTWTHIRVALAYPHAWIRLAAATLLSHLFADLGATPLDALPLRSSYGLELAAEDVLDVAYRASAQLNSPALTKEVAAAAGRNLMFCTRVFVASGMLATNLPPVADDADVDAAEEDDDAADEDEDEDEDDDAPKKPAHKPALVWLLSRLSGILRSERNIRLGLLPKRAALAWMTSLLHLLSPPQLTPLLPALIRPLFNLNDLPPHHTMAELKPLAGELLASMQERVGTTEYLRAYSAVKGEVMEKRGERRGKRKLLAVARPEVAAKRKARKMEAKKTQRKERGQKEREKRRGKML